MHIYFSGIGGVAIGPLAEIALDAGYSISGSDSHSSLMSDQLQKLGVNVSLDQTGDFLQNQHLEQPIDWLCYTAALPLDHPELLLARQLGIKVSKRDALTAKIIHDKELKLIAIAGTHGKTTTTGMFIWAFRELNIPASYAIGTTINFGPSGHYDPKSEYFVYECDEFDRNFLNFHPDLSIITSLDYDHPDTYPSPDSYKEAFRQFIDQSKQTFIWQRDSSYLEEGLRNTIVLPDNHTSNMRLAGAHNRANAGLVVEALAYLGLADKEAVSEALASFPGTNRRFEKLAENLYSDYGHHPKEIAATLQMAKEIADKVVLVYQPHQNTRQHQIVHQYPAVFDDADKVYWLPTYLTREDPSLPVLSARELTAQLDQEKIAVAEMDNQLWQKLLNHQQLGDLVLFMGAGDIDTWARSQLLKD